MQQYTWSDMRRGALRPARTPSGLLPSRQAIPQGRDRLRDVVRPRELLLALHVRLGISQHDPRIHRDAGRIAFQPPGLRHSERVDGADDYVPRPRAAGGQEVRGDAELGEAQNQNQVDQDRCQGGIQVYYGQAQQGPQAT